MFGKRLLFLTFILLSWGLASCTFSADGMRGMRIQVPSDGAGTIDGSRMIDWKGRGTLGFISSSRGILRQQVVPTTYKQRLTLRGGYADVQGFRPVVPDQVSAWLEENFSQDSRKEIGYTMLGFGTTLFVLVCVPLSSIGVFMNRLGLLAANIMVMSGGLLLCGPGATRRYFLSSKRWISTTIMFLGIALIWTSRQMCLTGFCLELLGFLNIFGPLLAGFLRCLRPLVPSGVTACMRAAAMMKMPKDLVGDVAYWWPWTKRSSKVSCSLDETSEEAA